MPAQRGRQSCAGALSPQFHSSDRSPPSAGASSPPSPKPESTDRSLTGRAAGLPESSAGVPASAGRRRGRAGARSPRSAQLGGAEGAGARVRETCAGMLARASDPGPAL